MHLCLMAAACYFGRQEEAARLTGLPLDWLRKRWGHVTPRYAPADHLLTPHGQPIFATDGPEDVALWLRVARAYGPLWQATAPPSYAKVLADLCTLQQPPRTNEAFFQALVAAAIDENLQELKRSATESGV